MDKGIDSHNKIVILETYNDIFKGLTTCYDLNIDVRTIYTDFSYNDDKMFNDGPTSAHLVEFKNSLSNETSRVFYTDGSLSNLRHKDMSMGIVQMNPLTPQFQFYACISDWPSSTRAETMAILTAIYVCPKECSVTIMTD